MCFVGLLPRSIIWYYHTKAFFCTHMYTDHLESLIQPRNQHGWWHITSASKHHQSCQCESKRAQTSGQWGRGLPWASDWMPPCISSNALLWHEICWRFFEQKCFSDENNHLPLYQRKEVFCWQDGCKLLMSMWFHKSFLFHVSPQPALWLQVCGPTLMFHEFGKSMLMANAQLRKFVINICSHQFYQWQGNLQCSTRWCTELCIGSTLWWSAPLRWSAPFRIQRGN